MSTTDGTQTGEPEPEDRGPRRADEILERAASFCEAKPDRHQRR